MSRNSTSNNASAPRTDPGVPIYRNMITYVGLNVAAVTGVIAVVLIGYDLLFHADASNPYRSLVTYLIIPAPLIGGLALAILGIVLEWRRRRKGFSSASHYPVFDFNSARTRKSILAVGIITALFLVLSAIGGYQGYHFTESVEFCGMLCHQVMEPEYVTYHNSPHARVSCAECHIGSGASWFVKSKISGIGQVFAMLNQSYHLPIQTPVEDLRPARDTCEQCHWPEKISGSIEKVRWRFGYDRANTPWRYNLLVKVGSGSQELNEPHGVHWHVNPDIKVEYFAQDRKRLDIPWTRITYADGTSREYRRDTGFTTAPLQTETREMDCMDCHNRPSHEFRPPRDLVDEALGRGFLDRTLPYIKRRSVALLEDAYPDTETALKTIDAQMRDLYKEQMSGPAGVQRIEKTIALLQETYQKTSFPEHNVNWTDHAVHINHFRFPGCFRCHDGQMKSQDGRVLSKDCRMCHEIVSQAQGEEALEDTQYHIQDFIHPRGMDDIWKQGLCTDCHTHEKDLVELVDAQ